jgi:replicative DNA helicase
MLSGLKSTNPNQNSSSLSSIIELIVAKQRNGPTGTIKLIFDENQTKFLELDHI